MYKGKQLFYYNQNKKTKKNKNGASLLRSITVIHILQQKVILAYTLETHHTGLRLAFRQQYTLPVE